MIRAGRAMLALAVTPLLAACGETGTAAQVRDIATNVVTLQQGTTSELRDRRGQGPFREYDLPPEAMLDVLEAAMERADGRGQPPYVNVYPSRNYLEVVAKEFEKPRSTYKDAFRTAAIAIVHPVSRDEGRCRVETHHTRRGPFHDGTVAWDRDLQGWIDDALEDRAAVGLKPIP